MIQGEHIPVFNGKPIEFKLSPYVLTKAQRVFIESSLTSLLNDLEAFTKKAVRNKSLLKHLGVSPGHDLKPTPLGLHIPFARFDFVFDKETQNLKVLELNTDGTSSWNVTEWLNERAGIADSENPNLNLSLRLLEGLRAHRPKASQIVICDFKKILTTWEQDHLAQYWTQVGASISTAPGDEYGRFHVIQKSPTDKDWKKFEGALVYRRAVSWQLDAEKSKCASFLEMWRKKRVTVVGGRSSDVGMSKAWPAFLEKSAGTQRILPQTQLLDAKTRKIAKAEKDRWVIKGLFGAAGQGVIRGQDLSQKRWETYLLKAKSSVLQEKVELPIEDGKRVELGLYFINGKPSGYLCRTGHASVITSTSDDYMRPVQIVN